MSLDKMFNHPFSSRDHVFTRNISNRKHCLQVSNVHMNQDQPRHTIVSNRPQLMVRSADEAGFRTFKCVLPPQTQWDPLGAPAGEAVSSRRPSRAAQCEWIFQFSNMYATTSLTQPSVQKSNSRMHRRSRAVVPICQNGSVT